MSRRKRARNCLSDDVSAVTGLGLSDVSVEPAQGSKDQQLSGGLFQRTGKLIRTHWIVSAIIGLALFTTTALALKYLDDDAKRQRLRVSSPHVSKGATSWLDTINPFATAPLPNPTPQLSKEYIYAGSRLLAVDDANANAAPPADLAVWRPSSGMYYVLGGPGSQQTYYQWGTNISRRYDTARMKIASDENRARLADSVKQDYERQIAISQA